MDELESTRNQLDNTDELLEAARFSLSQVEGSLQRLQEEHVMLQTTEQVLRASNETLVEECDYARNQLQEMATQLSLANQKLWSKESELNAAVDQVQEYRQHLSMVEKKYDENRLVLASIETLEIRYVEEVNDLLAQFSNVDDVYDMSVVATPVSTTSSFRDILASPAPNTGMHTPLSANRSPAVVNADINAQLAESIQALRSKSGRVMSQLSSLQHKLREQYNENEHLAKQYDLCRLRLDKAEHDREELQQRYKVSETHVGELKEVATRLQSQTLQIADLTTSRQLQVKDKFVAFGEVLQKSVAHLLQHLDAQKLLNVHVVVSELKETVNTLAIRDDFAVGTDLSVLQSELDSFDHHVEHFFQRGVNVLSLIGGFMEGFAGEKASFVNELERVRGEFETEKQALQQEIDAERTKMTELREDNDRLYDQLNVANEQMQEMTVEMITLRQTNADFEERVGQLEDEIKQSFELNAEMSESLKDAENLQTELQEEIRGLHGELDRKEDSIKTLHDQITTLRRRLSDSDLQVEKVSSVVQRVKAEKEALENVRVSLESELERSRGEYLAILDKFNPVHSEDSGYVFELEKLLAALTSSADQIEDSMGNSDHNTSGEVSVVSSMASGNKHEDRYVEVQRRVEQAVTRLAKIRTRCREDGRNRKLLERQHQSLNDEMKKLLQMLETHQSAAQVAEKRILELETLLEGKDFDIKNFMSDLQHIKNDYNDLVDKCGTYEHTVEQLKKDNIRLSEDVQNKQSEMARVQRSLESCEVTVSRLQAELSTAKMDYQHVLIESEQRAQQLKVAQDNHQKALAALAQAEGSLIRERNSRNEVEGKLHLLEGEAGQAARNKIVHLSAELDRSKEDVRALQHIKIRQEDHIAGLEQELQLSKQQIQALETRIENILKERSSFAEEVAETKRKIQTAKESYELEKSLRLRSEAAIDALKRAQGEDMRKLNMEGLVTIRNNETESLHLLAEEEKRTLRGKIQELKMSCDEKEMLRQHEVHDKKKLEKEVETLQTLLAKRTNDLNTVNTHLSSFRKDGRVVRKQVLEVVSQITELVHKISLDMQLGFVENTSALSSMELKLEAIDTSAGKLPEALGVPALSEAAQKLKEYLTKYFSEHSKLRVQVEKRTDCEAERDALRIQVSSLQEQRSTLLNQHQEEKRALQQQLLRLKNDDSEVGRLLAQIANLEATVKKEKERKERAITELEDVRAEVDRLTGNSLAVRERTSVLGDEAAALHDEVQRLQNENHLLGMELDKMNAHRLALKSTIEVLDKKLKQASEPPLPVDRRVFEHMDMHVTNTVARFQARARAMEELANIYRQSLQTLSPEGPADKLTAYQQVFGDGGGKGGIYIKLAVGWIEKEINTIRTSYDEEIRCLDNQVGELYSKLKEHQAYEDEMRKQLEDYTKSFYR
ncbi:hypothetical protein EON65_00470 [archaeon]|nr:MAG: hypothetical protein EON65_00470 [archaeon]